MHWLFLSAILDFGFVQFFKFGQRRGYYAPVVVTANYLTVSVCIGAYQLATDGWTFPERSERGWSPGSCSSARCC